MTGEPGPILAVDGISKRFGGLQAIDKVSFGVRAGERLGLIGPNGAGKTTCLRNIAGLILPDAGSVHLAGRPITDLAIHRRVAAGLAMTNQIVKPLRALTVLDNVALAWGRRRVGGVFSALLQADRRPAREAAIAYLERVGIAEHAGHLATALPLGVLKRLEVARAMALEPKVLLLDEPLAGLNHVEAARLADLIASLTDDGLTIVLVEHNLREVMRVCERLVVLEGGRVLAEGEPTTVMQIPEVIRAYIGEAVTDA